MNIGNSKSILFTLCLALGGAGLSLQCQAGEQGGGVHKPSKPTKPGSGPKHGTQGSTQCQGALCNNEVIPEIKANPPGRPAAEAHGDASSQAGDDSNQRNKSEANSISTKSSETLTNKDAKQLAKDVNKAVSEGQTNNIRK